MYLQEYSLYLSNYLEAISALIVCVDESLSARNIIFTKAVK